MLAVALIPLIGGVLVGIGGFLGWRGHLARSGTAGVRTTATLRSDEAFRVGNMVAGVPTMAAGLVGAGAGLAAYVMPTAFGTVLAASLGVIGLLALVVIGGVLGSKAADAVPEPSQEGGCGGCACGAGGCGS